MPAAWRCPNYPDECVRVDTSAVIRRLSGGSRKFRMGEERTSFAVFLAALVGFAIGAGALGFVALSFGFSFLGYARGGIHSDWAYAVFLGALVCSGLGGVLAARAAVGLVKSWQS
jgi:hypothetical protein